MEKHAFAVAYVSQLSGCYRSNITAHCRLATCNSFATKTQQVTCLRSFKNCTYY